MTEPVSINGNVLTLEEFIAVTCRNIPVQIDGRAMDSMLRSREVVENLLVEGRPMYGINTGFGKFADKAITGDEIDTLQVNLIRADAPGRGAPSERNSKGSPAPEGKFPDKRFFRCQAGTAGNDGEDA